MSYDPATYWPARFAKQGPTYVAKGGRRKDWQIERDKIGDALRRVLWQTGTILDFGCGPGRFGDVLSSFGEYTGFDLVPEAAALNAYPTTNDLRKSYDVAVAVQVFQHIPNDEVIRKVGPYGKAWVVIDHEPLDNPAPHMKPRSRERIAELLGLRLHYRLAAPVLGHWVAVFK